MQTIRRGKNAEQSEMWRMWKGSFMQEQTEETHEEYPWAYDLMYNFRIKVCVTKALSEFLLDPNLINKENNNNSK